MKVAVSASSIDAEVGKYRPEYRSLSTINVLIFGLAAEYRLNIGEYRLNIAEYRLNHDVAPYWSIDSKESSKGAGAAANIADSIAPEKPASIGALEWLPVALGCMRDAKQLSAAGGLLGHDLHSVEIYDRASKPPVCSSSRSKLVDRAKTSIFPVESSGLQRLQGHYPHYHYHYLTPFSEHSSQISMTLVIVLCACLLSTSSTIVYFRPLGLMSAGFLGN